MQQKKKHNGKQLLEDLTSNTLCTSDMFCTASDFQHNCVIPVKSQLSQTFSSMMSCCVVIFQFLIPVKFAELRSFISEIKGFLGGECYSSVSDVCSLVNRYQHIRRIRFIDRQGLK